MAKNLSPQKPVYAHHRLLRELVSINHGDDYSPQPEELDRVAKTFSDMGGSWYRLYHGSTDDMTQLREVLKAAVKGGFVTKSSRWGA